VEELKQILELMTQYNAKHIIVYNIALNMCATIGDVESLVEIANSMPRRTPPDKVTLSSVLKVSGSGVTGKKRKRNKDKEEKERETRKGKEEQQGYEEKKENEERRKKEKEEKECGQQCIAFTHQCHFVLLYRYVGMCLIGCKSLGGSSGGRRKK